MIKLEIREVELKAQTSYIHTSKKLKQCIIHYNVNSQKYQKSLFVDHKTNILLEKNSINNYAIKVDPAGADKKIKGLLESKLNNLIKGLLSNHKKAMTLNGVGYWIKFNKNLNSSKDLSKPLSDSVSDHALLEDQKSEESESVYVEMNIGYKNSIKKEIPKDIIVYIGNESNISKSGLPRGSKGNSKTEQKNTRATGGITGLAAQQTNELVCECHDLDKLTNWMNSIKQLKPSYKDKYKQKGWSNVYSFQDK